MAGARYGAPKDWVQLNNFFRYDVNQDRWEILAPMKMIQYQPELFEIDGFIYAVGKDQQHDPKVSLCVSVCVWGGGVHVLFLYVLSWFFFLSFFLFYNSKYSKITMIKNH